MSRLRGGALAVALAIALGPAAASGDAPPGQSIADFEDAAYVETIHAAASSVEVVDQTQPAGGHALRWTLEKTEGSAAYIYLPVATPPDLEKNRLVQFRIRADGERAGELYVQLENKAGAWLGARVRGAGSEWKTMTFDLDSMERDGRFDPAAVTRVAFVVWESKGGSYLLDDVALLPAPPHPAAAAGGKSPPSSGTDAKKDRVVIADFESPESLDFADPERSTTERVAAGPKEKGSVLAWTQHAGGKTSCVELYGMPRDVRNFRTLRFRVRADHPVTQTLDVRFETSVKDVLSADVNGISTEWKTVEVRLPNMEVMREFDPRRVRGVAFIFFEPPEAVIQIDDVELETGAGGWRLTEPEMLVRAFGDARAKKVTKIPTKHFIVYTDSAAAQGKFPKALEEAYEFSKKTTGMPEMDETLPIYIFQNSSLYVDFCVRYAHWTKELAEQTAGHGSGRYFATYYQSPDAPTVVHELTHSLFHRTRGAQGGSWFQEGVAVYVEHAWQKQSAAEIFSANLRSGQFVHLAEFMAFPTLVVEHDTKGGPRTADRLYLQAGAFYEFLVRGPLADEARAVIPVLARTPKPDAEMPAYTAKLFGRSLDDLEKEWIAWGSNPPKVK